MRVQKHNYFLATLNDLQLSDEVWLAFFVVDFYIQLVQLLPLALRGGALN